MRRTFFVALLGCALPLFAACATTGVAHGKANTVDEYYAQALDDLKNQHFQEAVDAFENIKARYPYSKYAALSDLRIADTWFEREQFIEAIDAYRSFLKYHPTHAEVSYAMFRIAESYRKQIPTDWFILPPSAEKDQASTRMAISAYRDVLTRYPTSEYAEKAQEALDGCRRKLADHEMYVASFYYKREKYLAAALRAEGVLRDYPGLGLDAEALYVAGTSRYYTGELKEARTFLTQLTMQFQDSSQAKKAKSVLEDIDKNRLPKLSDKTPAIEDISSPARSPAAIDKRRDVPDPVMDETSAERHNPDPSIPTP